MVHITVTINGSDGSVETSVTVTVDNCPLEVVVAIPPTKYDFCYKNVDSVLIPSTVGVSYFVNGTDVSGLVLRFNGLPIVVTASALPGYTISGESNWAYGISDFSDLKCVTVTKNAATITDTNGDGRISSGDLATWHITAINTSSDATADWFYITVNDPGTILENNGHIGVLDTGQSRTLTATKALTADEVRACQAINLASYDVWYNYSAEEGLLFDNLDHGTTSATLKFTCPAPVGHVEGASTVITNTQPVPTKTTNDLPAMIPATGPSHIANPLFVILPAIIAYGATLFIQNRRDLAKKS